MRRITTTLLIALAAPALAGCRSPFGVEPEAPSGPEAGKVGRGIHGWPLLEHTPHGSGWRTDVLWPAYSALATDDDGLNSTGVLMPLFLFESEGERTRTGILRPLYDLETKGDDTFDLDVLWPIFKWVDAPGKTERRVAPFYYSRDEGDAGERHYWPFYGREWSGAQEKQWVLAPLFAHDRRPDDDPAQDISLWDAPWPLIRFGHAGNEEQLHVLPLLWHEATPTAHTTIVFPFIWDIEDERSDFKMLFPLYAKLDAKNGDYVRSVLPPLYITGRQGDTEHTALAASIVGWRTSPDAWAAHAFPVFWIERQDDGDGSTHVWPLFGWKEQGETREASTLWPLFTYEWDDDSWEFDAPWPLGSFKSAPNGGEAMLWPLFSNESYTDADGVTNTTGDVGLFLSTWESRGDDESDFRILWKLVESTRHAGKDTLVVNPLFRHEANDAGDTYWSFLFGLISRKQEAGAVDWGFLWLL